MNARAADGTRPAKTPVRSWLLTGVGALLLLAGGAVVVFLYAESLERGMIDSARTQMKRIARVVEEYRLNYEKWPATLQILTERIDLGMPYIKDSEFITDPWGHLYGYDPDDPEGPLIFCTTPRGQLLTQRV